MKLLTNNPEFLKYKNKKIEVDYRNVSYLEILETARDFIHGNYELMTHPLYGSIKPNETLYRTIILKKGEKLEFNSVTLISDAIETFMKFSKNRKTPEWTESIKEDFKVIDYDLISNAIERIVK